MPSSSTHDLEVFESLRSHLLSLAYRMLGDAGRAQDMVQEAWLRWHQRGAETVIDSPRAFLVTIVTRLCLNELASARSQREESRSDRLPEPVDLVEMGIDALEERDQVSMAFLVVLERLTPAERAVLLLHDVFDFAHDEIATLVERTPEASRKLLERAREKVATGRRMFTASRDEHQRLLQAFFQAVTSNDVPALIELLAEDAVLITDGGVRGRVAGATRSLPRPLEGAARIAAFVTATRGARAFTIETHELNGQPALVFQVDGGPFAALLLGVADGKIQRVFFHADPDHLRYLGPSTATTLTRGGIVS